jgi:hypothetical protein
MRDSTHRTPTATIAAFKYVVSLNDSERLKKFLDEHPYDIAALREIKQKEARLQGLESRAQNRMERPPTDINQEVESINGRRRL